jgi:hypothetical protein
LKELRNSKEKNISTKTYSTKFPVAPVESDFIWKIARALMSPGDLEFPLIKLENALWRAELKAVLNE